MIHPDASQLESLDRFERAAFLLCDQFNRHAILKRAGHLYLRTFGASWVHFCTQHLMHVQGMEHILSLAPDRGVVLVANHRTFFDLYMITSVMLRSTSWVERMYFPVRSNFFYERVEGVMVNAVMSALAMYPPIHRDVSKRAINQYAVDVMVELAQQPGTVIGIHPEGTRGKGEDPYQLLPSQPGIGQIVHRARPIVLPVFVLGGQNNFGRQVLSNFDRTGDPITITFGAPLDLSAHYAAEGRLRTYKQIADQIGQELTRLGQEDRRFRQKLGLRSLDPATLVEA
jgi:1-acyl-sn-glycerol-3-phosphate acyltransferase